MTDEQAADNDHPGPTGTPDDDAVAWAPWLAWGWVVLVLLVAIAELTGWEDLRLALDLQRLFR